MSSMKVECTGCGKDCSNVYGTYEGWPYHISCIPSVKRRLASSAQPAAQQPSDLVRRLRDFALSYFDKHTTTHRILREAADRIEALEAALKAIEQRGNEHGTGQMAFLETIHAMHDMARKARVANPPVQEVRHADL